MVKDYLKELDDMNIKELKIPTWNELLGMKIMLDLDLYMNILLRVVFIQ